jgi:hypothetical protein
MDGCPVKSGKGEKRRTAFKDLDIVDNMGEHGNCFWTSGRRQKFLTRDLFLI